MFPGHTQDPLYGYFAAVAGQDGQIDADELQRCLTQSGIAGGYKRKPWDLSNRILVLCTSAAADGNCSFKEIRLFSSIELLF